MVIKTDKLRCSFMPCSKFTKNRGNCECHNKDAEASNGEKPTVIRWAAYPAVRPKGYGRYLVYRAGCQKMHFETWNNTGWAYNNQDITHWTDVEPPIV